jgi:hypothetical protein
MQKKKKYYYNALAHRLSVYPDTIHFRMFAGQCFTHQIGRSSLLNEILKSYFATKFTESEREYLLKKYDEYMIIDLLNTWHEIRQGNIRPEYINFLYDKIKYKKVMRLNIGFNEVDFKWPVMIKVFDAVFSNADLRILKEAMSELSDELKKHTVAFYETVKVVKKQSYKNSRLLKGAQQ